MTDPATALTADAIGALAARTLGRSRNGQVIAVFQSAFYVAFDADLVCITTRDTDLGPLSLRTTAARATDWRRVITPGQSVSVVGTALRVGRQLSIATKNAAPVRPPLQTAPIHPGRILRNLADARRCLPERHEDAGLAAVLRTPGATPLTCRAAPLIAAARGWLDRRDPANMSWAIDLLGLGPGLTPSGDDLLGAMLIALRRTGQTALADRLWHALAPACPARSNPISEALLRAAAGGHASLSLLGALEALISGDDLPRAVARLGQQGHSSGWDSLIGLILVLESVAQQTERTLA